MTVKEAKDIVSECWNMSLKNDRDAYDLWQIGESLDAAKDEAQQLDSKSEYRLSQIKKNCRPLTTER